VGTLYHYLHPENYVKKEPAFSDFREAVVVLNLSMCINWDELCTEFCIILSVFALYLKDESK